MTSAPQSARARLDRADEQPAWARFDAAWYAGAHAMETSDAGVLRRFYLAHGQSLRHSPNPLFDERWHLRRYPDVAEMVAAGTVESGFDHFCREGFRARKPHWLFDRDHVVATLGGQEDVYGAFLRHGSSPHRLFDESCYLEALDDAARDEAEREGAYAHYLGRLGIETPEPRASPFFDPAWYLEHHGGVAEAVARGEWRGALHHYLTNEAPTAFDPLPQFSEAFYLAQNPDVAAAVRAGDVRNGFAHFLASGAGELRAPREDIDLAYYLASYPDVAIGLRDGAPGHVFLHYLTHGAARAASPSSLSEMPAEHAAKALWRAQADAMLPLHARRPIDFEMRGAPALSVVMVLHNQFALALRSLASLRANFAGDIELILTDSGSTDETRHLRRYVRGARLLPFDVNIGFVRACNAGLQGVTAPLVLFLNTDVELAPGAIAAALARMEDASIGAVGAKIVRSHGMLQEAGSIVWKDGATEGYMRDASPLAPEANFVRDVDFCSGAFLMTRAKLLEELEGFDDDYAPAYFEDADLCFRIAGLGRRVVYDPAIVVHHLEYGSADGHFSTQSRMLEKRAVFAAKHPEAARRPESSEAGRVVARTAGPRRTRVLMIEDYLPLRRIGSGFVRSNDILAVMASLGHHVTVFPINGNSYDLAAVYADMPDSVEVMHDQSFDTLEEFLRRRPGYYDVVWVARTHNLDKAADLLATWAEASAVRPRFVLDTEAVAATRSAVRARQRGEEFGLIAALVDEFANVDFCQDVVAVNETDAATLRNLGIGPVAVLGHMRELALSDRAWDQRSGMLFVGSIHAMDSPNYEGLSWFVDEVLPLIEAELGWETRLTVIGHLADGVSLERFADHPRVTLRGSVVDARPAYDSHRVFVAPTRWAGGVAYKVHEAASFGLPVVTTELIRSQLGWDDGAVLSADASDPAGFAEAVLRLHRDPAAWAEVRAKAAARIAAENAAGPYVARIRALVGAPPENVVPFIGGRPDA